MIFEGALIKEQGVKFAIVIVKQHIINSSHTANQAIASFQPTFPSVPVILMSQDFRGTPTYYGRRDIVNFLKNVPLQCIPWQKFST